MKIINLKREGYLDYALGAMLFFIPDIFHIEPHTSQSLLFYMYGIFVIFLSLHTDYKAGLYKLLPAEAHLGIEIASGLFFVLSPWIFGFVAKTFLVHVLTGGVMILLNAGAVKNNAYTG